MLGLYVHIPFCARKCRYCDFYSVAGKTALLDRYLDFLFLEAEKYAGAEFETLYIGGGTPSVLRSGRLEALMKGLSRRLGLKCLVEATIEVNPESSTREFMTTAVSLGINRVSIGVQSLNDEELRKQAVCITPVLPWKLSIMQKSADSTIFPPISSLACLVRLPLPFLLLLTSLTGGS